MPVASLVANPRVSFRHGSVSDRSVKTIATIVVLFSVLLLSGCFSEQPNRLIGTWQTELIPSEWGSNQITVSYFSDGRVAGTNDFPGEGALNWEGTFRRRGDVIERTMEGHTQEFLFRIEGDTMYQKMGDEDYTFRRVFTEPSGPANGSQPIRSKTNTTSSAAGSRR
jgi:hypothetical protein